MTKITVTQTDYYNHDYTSTTITAETEFGKIQLLFKDEQDKDQDWGAERTESSTHEYFSAEEFFDAGWETTGDITDILSDDECEEIKTKINNEKRDALARGERSFCSNVDGSYWIYKPKCKTWKRVTFDEFFTFNA